MKFPLKTIVVSTCCALMLGSSMSVWASPFEDGMKAYHAKNYTQAIALFQQSSKQGVSSATLNLGIMHEFGYGVPKSLGEAAKWYLKAAQQNNAQAQEGIASMYRNGEGVPQSKTKALKWYRKAAEQGRVKPQFRLGYAYEKGEGVPQSYEKARIWYKKAADQGYKFAQYNIGLLHEYGRGGLKNEVVASWAYEKAAKQGHKGAQYRLGYLYEWGTGIMNVSDEKSVYWYRKAADQGHVKALKKIKALGDNGLTEKENQENKTSDFAQVVAAAKSGDAQAQYKLGGRYTTGWNGHTVDAERAFHWYIKAAEQGQKNAQYTLGWMYGKGTQATPHSLEKSVYWYTKAATQGEEYAAYNLAELYYAGKGVPQSDVQTAYWFKKSAEHGNPAAQLELGFLYEKGIGLEMSPTQSAHWYEEARQRGHEKTKSKIKRQYDAAVAEKFRIANSHRQIRTGRTLDTKYLVDAEAYYANFSTDFCEDVYSYLLRDAQQSGNALSAGERKWGLKWEIASRDVNPVCDIVPLRLSKYVWKDRGISERAIQRRIADANKPNQRTFSEGLQDITKAASCMYQVEKCSYESNGSKRCWFVTESRC